ncbi:MAG: DUF721 domain-containing protein [Myxococcales bacterium]|nr:DUF721 domain-containing protein [Myxococcales bacterium]
MAVARSGKRRRNSAPTTLGALLSATPAGKAATEVLVTRALWEQVAGVAFARRTMPDRLSRGTLYVVVSSSGWAQELAIAERTLVERLRARGVEVQHLRARVGEVPEMDRGGILAPSRPELARARTVEAPAPLVAAVHRVADPELRETLDRVARALARKEAEVEVRTRAEQQKPKPRIPGSNR